MKHLLSIEQLSREEIEAILDRAESFAEVGRRDIKKVPTLRGRTVVTPLLRVEHPHLAAPSSSPPSASPPTSSRSRPPAPRSRRASR